MPITIIEKNKRFACRAGIIIFNEKKDKVLIEDQGDFCRLPGGRIEFFEDSETTITRELKEELNIKLDIALKYISEMIIKQGDIKYHEIGFYYLTETNEKSITDNQKSLDNDSYFKWIDISKLNKYNIIEKPIIDKILKNIKNKDIEIIKYKEK